MDFRIARRTPAAPSTRPTIAPTACATRPVPAHDAPAMAAAIGTMNTAAQRRTKGQPVRPDASGTGSWLQHREHPQAQPPSRFCSASGMVSLCTKGGARLKHNRRKTAAPNGNRPAQCRRLPRSRRHPQGRSHPARSPWRFAQRQGDACAPDPYGAPAPEHRPHGAGWGQVPGGDRHSFWQAPSRMYVGALDMHGLKRLKGQAQGTGTL